MSKLLISEPPLQVLPTLAVAVGLNEAIVLQQLHYLTGRSNDPWVEKRLSEWLDVFPFWSKPTLKRAFASLRAKALIEVEQPHGTDRMNRYRLLYEAVEKLPASDPVDGINLSPSSGSNRAVPSGQDDPLEEGTSIPSNGADRSPRTGQDDPLYIAREVETAEGLESATDVADSNVEGPATTEPSSFTANEEQQLRDERGASARNHNPEFERLARLLATRIVENGSRAPSERQVLAWRNDVRLMVERDDPPRTLQQIESCIEWCQADDFWRANILSMGTLREKFDRMRLSAQRDRGGRGDGNAQVLAMLEAEDPGEERAA